tara:strand:+ start:57 stop:407 length:351 start_codon:yes stop_codon:yes gene_type:complete
MYNLIDSTNKHYIEYINTALRRYGVDSVVIVVGKSPDGNDIYSTVCPSASEASQARNLLYSDNQFINDIAPEFSNQLRITRNEKTMGIAELLTSKTMFKISVVAFIIVLLGYLLGF